MLFHRNNFINQIINWYFIGNSYLNGIEYSRWLRNVTFYFNHAKVKKVFLRMNIIPMLALGKRVSENYRNLSEFWRQIAEQLFCDRFGGILGANSSQFTDFVAIHTKSKILICLELLISFINTVTAWLITNGDK